MNRLSPSARLFLGLLAAAAVFAGSYWAAAWFRSHRDHPHDELAWLTHEFQLTDAELTHIRTLHESYRPRCEAMCARVAEKNRQLKSLLDGAATVSPEVEHKLAEIATLRAECQLEMLRHYQAVAHCMSEKEGARYLAEMQRLTLGLQDQMEAGMMHHPHEHP